MSGMDGGGSLKALYLFPIISFYLHVPCFTILKSLESTVRLALVCCYFKGLWSSLF